MTQRLDWIIVAFLLAVGSGWLLYYFNEQGSADRRPAVETPTAYMKNFTLTSLDDAGEIAYQLSGERMEHFASDGSTTIDEPRMVFYGADGAVWYARSPQGWASEGNKEIVLRGDVTIWNGSDDPDEKIELETQNLKFLPQLRYAQTARPAKLRSAAGVTRGKGLKIWLDELRVEFGSEVRGRYEFD